MPKLISLLAALLLAFGYHLLGSDFDPAEFFSDYTVSSSSTASQSTPTDGSELMRLDIIDVGQGSGALLQVFDDEKTLNIMIDSGEKTAQKAVVSHLEANDVKKLDLVIITHPHTDHFGGILQVLKDYEIDELWLPYVSEKLTPTNSTYISFLDLLEQNGCDVVIKSEPETLYLSNDVTLELLDAFLDEPSNLNNTSLCIRIDAHEASFLITGDAESAQEDKMREGNENIDVDLFVAGHHGSNSSNKQYFLNAVSPLATVISVGKDNEYNHPAPKALERISKFGNVYRTDLNGTVSLSTDGETITVTADGINDKIDAKG